jgi:hypothetical protein
MQSASTRTSALQEKEAYLKHKDQLLEAKHINSSKP